MWPPHMPITFRAPPGLRHAGQRRIVVEWHGPSALPIEERS